MGQMLLRMRVLLRQKIFPWISEKSGKSGRVDIRLFHDGSAGEQTDHRTGSTEPYRKALPEADAETYSDKAYEAEDFPEFQALSEKL